MDLYENISNHLQQGDDEEVLTLVKKLIQDNASPADILNKGLIGGMNVVGEKFKAHEIFLPDVLMAAKAMMAGMDELKPLLIKKGVPTLGKVVIGTVKGDLHDIGKNLVGIMLKGAGFDVIDLGNDVPPATFIDTVEAENASIIGLSALLTTTMPMMKEVVELLKERNLRDRVKVIIGGAPVSEDFANEIGADKYSYDAANAVETVKTLLQ